MFMSFEVKLCSAVPSSKNMYNLLSFCILLALSLLLKELSFKKNLLTEIVHIVGY